MAAVGISASDALLVWSSFTIQAFLALSPCGGLSPLFPFFFNFIFIMFSLSSFSSFWGGGSRRPSACSATTSAFVSSGALVAASSVLTSCSGRHQRWLLPFLVASFSASAPAFCGLGRAAFAARAAALFTLAASPSRCGFVFRWFVLPAAVPSCPGFMVPAPGLSAPWLLVWVSRCWSFCPLAWCLLPGG